MILTTGVTRFSHQQRRQGGAVSLPVIVGIVVLAVLLGIWLYWQSTAPDETLEPLSSPAPAQVDPEPEEVVPEAAPPPPEPETAGEPIKPLPSLEESDAVVLAEAGEIETLEPALEYSAKDNVLRKWVRAVLALEEGVVVHEYRPIASPKGKFVVEPLDEKLDPEVGQRYRLSEKNYERYDGYVDALENLDKEEFARLYQRFYPLLDLAYQQQGVNKGGLHTVVLKAIDSMLAAPVIEEEVILVQPKVHYKFADQKLEKLPEPQKLLIRTGPENTRRIQENLRELKAAIENL